MKRKEHEMTEQELLRVEHPMDLNWGIQAGPTFSTFLHFLRRGKLAGQRCSACGKVYLPPRPVCGDCFEPLTEWVAVGETGTVIACARVHHAIVDPWTGEKRKVPYGVALIRLDGADTFVNHYIAEEDLERLKIGLRVRAVWREPRRSMKDLLHFRALEEPERPSVSVLEPLAPPEEVEPIAVDVRVPLTFSYAAGEAGSRFLTALRRGEILGSRCPRCQEVRVPLRKFCPLCLTEPLEEVPVGPKGNLRVFVPLPAAPAEGPKRGLGLIRLDGADNDFLHFVTLPARPKDRVQARFREPSKRLGSLLDIECFERTAPGG